MSDSTHREPARLLQGPLLKRAFLDALRKLNPIHQLRNPVMFVVWICSAFVTLLWLHSLCGNGEARPGFILQIALWLWFTLFFANLAEALAEGRGKAQADALRATRRDVTAKRLQSAQDHAWSPVNSALLKVGDLVLVEAGDT